MASVALGLGLIGTGAFIETVSGSFAHWFDWRWPKQHYPVGGESARVLTGRVLLILGCVVLVVVLLA